MAQERDIKYIDRNFSDLRGQLIEMSKNYFPDTYNDFSPTSPGMMVIEMAAVVGDILSFYQDTQLQETFIQHAKDPGNLMTLAYMMGYRPKITSASEVELEVSQRVAAVAPNYTPNWDQAITIAQNSTVKANTGTGTTFVLKDRVDFNFSSSYDPTNVSIYSLAGSNPAEFTLKKKVKAFSGTIKTVTRTYTNAEKFSTITLDDENIIGVLDITDTENNTWYEVPFLGQDSIFLPQTNGGSDNGSVPNLLLLQKVPRRFTTRFNSTGQLTVQFGAGISGDDDTTFLPNPTNVGMGTDQGVSRLGYAYDPSNFLFSRAYGLAPSNTVLTIRYLTGGGVSSNEPANTVTNLDAVTTSATDSDYVSTLTFTNPEPAYGGKDGDSVEEIRQNSLRAFNEQGRTVTTQDYNVRALSLPAKYGTIAKSYLTRDHIVNARSTTDAIVDNNPLALSLYILAYDNEGKLTKASASLRENLKTYLHQFMMLTDAINLKDAFIVNIGVKFDIIALPNYTGRDVLLKCTEVLQDYFKISKWNINQPINLSNLYTELDRVKGVQTVQKIEITNKVGGNYSIYAYDTKGATRNNVVYPSIDPCIFEVKYPNIDIEGRITTL